MAEALTSVFWGSPELAVPALRLLQQRTRVLGVVTQPDKPAGRGNRLTPPPIKVAALDLGLPLWQPERLRPPAKASGADVAPAWLAPVDLYVVMAYGKLLPPRVLGAPTACVNLHASILPRWRGASPLHAALRAGDARTGVSVMRMVPAMDAGPVYLTEVIDLAPRETLASLHDRIAACAAAALGRFLDAWPAITPVEQDHAAATACHKLPPDAGRLRPLTADAVDLDRLARAYHPWPGCFAIDDRGQRFGVHATELRPEVEWLAPGAVRVAVGPGGARELHVGCQGGTVLAITRIQAPGKKPMPVADFLNGHPAPARID